MVTMLECWACRSLAVWPWASCSASLCLSFFSSLVKCKKCRLLSPVSLRESMSKRIPSVRARRWGVEMGEEGLGNGVCALEVLSFKQVRVSLPVQSTRSFPFQHPSEPSWSPHGTPGREHHFPSLLRRFARFRKGNSFMSEKSN